MRRTPLVYAGLFLLVPLFVPALHAEGKHALTVEDLFRFKRVADPQISPDGKAVSYTLTMVDLPGNRTTTNIWLASTEIGDPRPLTNGTKHDRHPRWSPDGAQILFESDRSGENQLWVIDVHGGEARQLTTIASEAGNGIWSPDGKAIAFVSAVYPEYSDKPFKESNALNKQRKEDAAKNPVKARVFTKLFYRHWDDWVEDKRQHLFVIPAAGGEPRDVTPGDRDANPTSDTFSAGDDFTFSPDGQYLVYTATPERNEAWSTNYDICRSPVAGGKAECLTTENKAADGAPAFSPDGRFLAYRAQRRPGFESDRWEIMVTDAQARGKPRSITTDFDSSPAMFIWGPDSKTIYFVAEEKAASPIYAVSIETGKPEKILEGSTNSSLSISKDGKTLAFARVALNHPAEAFVATGFSPSAQETKLAAQNKSRANADLLNRLDMPRPESVTVAGAGGTPMQMWILKPPGFDASKKWPLAFLVHGGPQGAWEDGWSFRWNAEAWAAQGYVVALPNPRGSTGFGQKYVDEISGDWGGKCFEDLMAGLAFLEKQPYIDPERMGAAGASFGGYMMNWFQGHTTKFKTLITHCGVYNFDSMYATTDEIWFDEWEHGGPPWGSQRESYEKFSPHRYAKEFKTPMLIIHNDRDFRVPLSEGFQLFSTLQRQGIPSKMINFPDESHWVLKPANSAYWHKEVFAWLKKYVPPGGR
ncbi:MAG TPA: S9 family peptidase [Gemmataceae bacterium]|nr:S9 family peptidase [Gemmataceae bacterium]